MKNFGILFMFFFVLISCSSSDAEEKSSSNYGKWELTEMITNFDPAANSTTTPQWKESYVFYNDGKFAKTRIKDNKTVTESGSYAATKVENETKFELVFEKPNEIAATCATATTRTTTITTTKERLLLNSEGKLQNTLRSCNGPIFVYTKK